MLKISKLLTAMNNDYSQKSEAELQYIIKDAGEAAKAMQGHSPESENKYLDQVNDAVTELNRRKNPPMRGPRKRSPEELQYVIKDAGEALRNAQEMGDQAGVAKYQAQVEAAQREL